MGSIGHIGSHIFQDFGQNLEDGSSNSGALASSPSAKLSTHLPSQDAGSTQGLQSQGTTSNSERLSAMQSIGDELEQLQQLILKLSQQPGSTGSAGNSNNAGAAPASTAAPTNTATPASAAAPAGAAAPPSAATPASAATLPSAAAPASAANGSSVDIDGGNVSGHGVIEQVDNNTGAAARFGWENAQGKLVGEQDLQQGQTGSFDVNADGPDGKSARLIKLNQDGSIPDSSNLDEANLAVNPDGSLQVSQDVSQITAGNDATQIQITDGNGQLSGNNAPGGAYQYPMQDQVPDPSGNPMKMAMDTSKFYDNNFTG